MSFWLVLAGGYGPPRAIAWSLTLISNSSARTVNLAFASKFCLLIAIGTVILMQSPGQRNKD